MRDPRSTSHHIIIVAVFAVVSLLSASESRAQGTVVVFTPANYANWNDGDEYAVNGSSEGTVVAVNGYEFYRDYTSDTSGYTFQGDGIALNPDGTWAATYPAVQAPNPGDTLSYWFIVDGFDVNGNDVDTDTVSIWISAE